MRPFEQFRRKQIPAELRPYEPGEDLLHARWRGDDDDNSTSPVSISDVDHKAGSPKAGDWIARNPLKHADQWLISAQYFAENFEAP